MRSRKLNRSNRKSYRRRSKRLRRLNTKRKSNSLRNKRRKHRRKLRGGSEGAKGEEAKAEALAKSYLEKSRNLYAKQRSATEDVGLTPAQAVIKSNYRAVHGVLQDIMNSDPTREISKPKLIAYLEAKDLPSLIEMSGNIGGGKQDDKEAYESELVSKIITMGDLLFKMNWQMIDQPSHEGVTQGSQGSRSESLYSDTISELLSFEAMWNAGQQSVQW